jgi:membrane dipeptidase
MNGLPRSYWISNGSDKKLSASGKAFVEKMNNIGIMIDLAELDESIYSEILQITKKPVFVSHACCKAIADHPLNLSDKAIKEIAANNGVIAVSFSNELLSSRKPSRPNYKNVVEHIDHIVKLTESVDYVGLGFGSQAPQSRPDGLKTNSELFNITNELKERGYSDRDIKKILGDNFLRVFRSQI